MDEIEMMKMKRRKEERKKNIKLGLLWGVIGISVAICLIFTVFKPKPQKELVLTLELGRSQLHDDEFCNALVEKFDGKTIKEGDSIEIKSLFEGREYGRNDIAPLADIFERILDVDKTVYFDFDTGIMKAEREVDIKIEYNKKSIIFYAYAAE